jgi:mRNA-degrading endonuclease RelE of RelBE toxin-antitoxin system
MRRLSARQRSKLLKAIEDQLGHETRNRKRMLLNEFATWELRVENLRVYYEVTEEPEAVVSILAVGIKIRQQVFVGGEAIQL